MVTPEAWLALQCVQCAHVFVEYETRFFIHRMIASDSLFDDPSHEVCGPYCERCDAGIEPDMVTEDPSDEATT